MVQSIRTGRTLEEIFHEIENEKNTATHTIKI